MQIFLPNFVLGQEKIGIVETTIPAYSLCPGIPPCVRKERNVMATIVTEYFVGN